MIPKLPRELLWTDKETMEEFFKLDRRNEDFFEVFVTLREEPFVVETDEVKVFNEVYYQVTRMVFESPSPIDLDTYVNDIKANMGWNYSAELVMSIAYFLLSLIDKKTRPIDKFFTKAINDRFWGCMYWKPFKHRFETLKKQKKSVRYKFEPCPNDVKDLYGNFFNWQSITRNFNIGCMAQVLNLWTNEDDQKEVAKMMKAVVTYGSMLKRNDADYDKAEDYLSNYINNKEECWMCAEASPFDNYHSQDHRIMDLENENMMLKTRVRDLETENERLKAMLEKKKRTGMARKFTLVQIVDYCKRCVDWNDAKSIVAMLNKLLRRIGTDEDSNLVDSIEEEFKNRVYGNIFNAPVGQVLQRVDRVENNTE